MINTIDGSVGAFNEDGTAIYYGSDGSVGSVDEEGNIHYVGKDGKIVVKNVEVKDEDIDEFLDSVGELILFVKDKIDTIRNKIKKNKSK